MNAYKNIDVVRIGGIYERKHERTTVNQKTDRLTLSAIIPITAGIDS